MTTRRETGDGRPSPRYTCLARNLRKAFCRERRKHGVLGLLFEIQNRMVFHTIPPRISRNTLALRGRTFHASTVLATKFHACCGLALAIVLFFGSCRMRELLDAPVEEVVARAGETTVYLQPCPPETTRLRFEIRGIQAVSEDRAREALSPAVAEINGAARTERQTILATGVLPPGRYTGLAVQIGEAFVLGEEGESSLLVPEPEIQVPHAFIVSPNRSTVLFLTLRPEGNVAEEVRFTPSFTLSTSRSELASLVGYVTNPESDSITLFNKATMNISGVISTGRKPKGIVLDSRQHRAYVALEGDAAVEVIDLFKETTEAVIPLIFGDLPQDLALTPDGRTVLVANKGSNTVSVIDTLSLVETERINVGRSPLSVVIHRDGVRAFVMNALSNSISVVDLSRDTVTGSIAVDGPPLRGVFDRSGRKLFVIQSDTPYLTAIDDARLSVAEKTFIGIGATFLVSNNASDLLLVAMGPTRELAVIDPFSSVVLNSLAVSGRISYMVFDSQESSLFAVFPEERRLKKINAVNGTVIAEIELSKGSYAVAVMGES